MNESWAPFVVVWIVCGMIGAAIGQAKGNGKAGFWLGLLLGPLGILIAAVMARTPEAEAQHLRAVQAAMGGGTRGWWPDPHQRHQLRYYDGVRWTEHVSDAGIQSPRRDESRPPAQPMGEAGEQRGGERLTPAMDCPKVVRARRPGRSEAR